MRHLRSLALVAVFAFGVTTVSAAEAVPAKFNGADKIGCRAARDLHRHGLSGAGIPIATVRADLQSTEAGGTRPYRADAKALSHALVRGNPWKADDRKMVRACRRH